MLLEGRGRGRESWILFGGEIRSVDGLLFAEWYPLSSLSWETSANSCNAVIFLYNTLYQRIYKIADANEWYTLNTC